MSRRLSVARAAYLIGVPRGVLQRMVQAGELQADDGLIDLGELQRLFPSVSPEEAGALERVQTIREEAFGKRVRERLLPSQEVLAQRLFAQSRELAEMRGMTQSYHRLVQEIRRRLDALLRVDDGLRPLSDFIDRELAQLLGEESSEPLETMATMLEVISAQVTVRPSGHQFLLEGNESILQAGLKSGLRFSYGCSSGNCGLCKARLIAGELRQIQQADYRLSEVERQQGYVLLCAHTAVSDVVIETLEASGPQDIPQQDIVCSVRAIAELGSFTRLLHLQTPRSNRLRFLAGQSVTLGVATPHGDVQQVFALASCPCDERNLHIHVGRGQDGPVTALLFDGELKANSAVNVRGPLGDFVVDASSTRPALFLACDTGFGPIKSLIEHLIASEQVEAFALCWVATGADGHYLANQCRAWEAAFDNFSFTALSDDNAGSGAGRAVDALRSRYADLARCDCFVAGPAEFVDAAQSALAAAGAAAPRQRTLVL
jgi:CDP-4-dehydro-6-deoxyglucose reductase, E3